MKILNILTKNLIPIIVGGLILSLIFNFNSCDTIGNQRIEIKKIKKELVIASKEGTFNPRVDFTPLIERDTIRDTIEGKPMIVMVENPVNKKLQEDFKKLNDSLKIIAYNDATNRRKYKEVFEDDNVVITIKTEVDGYLRELYPDYLIKPQTVEYTEIERSIYNKPTGMLYLGVNLITDPKEYKGAAFGVSLGFMNSKGTHFELGYNTNMEVNFSLKKTLFTRYK